MPPPLFEGARSLSVRALCLGERIELRSLSGGTGLSAGLLCQPVGLSGYVIIFRYGCVVFFGASQEEQESSLQQLSSRVTDPVYSVYSEELELEFDGSEPEWVSNGRVGLLDRDPIKLQLVADALAKSVVLDHYEATIAEAFREVEPLALRLKQKGKSGERARALIVKIGTALVAEQRLVSRVAVADKPEALWDRSDLELLYAKLQDEYEVRERGLALERKLNLLTTTVGTILNLLHNKRALRVEWYIVVLIVTEIVLTIYELAFH